ncbi:MAG: SpoIIE family protein phosphatase, partial [bacterium]|nr:SpoIIE family protein phosphatase [bacterium]
SNDDCLWVGADEGMRITGIAPDGAADKAGIKDGDILLKIDGKEFSNPFQAQSHIDSLPEGRTARYTIRRVGQLLEVDVLLRKLPTVFSTVSSGVGFVFLLTGYLVIIFNPLKRLSRFFFYLCFVTFVFLSLNQVAVPGYLLLFQVMNILRLVFISMWGPAMLHFFLVFPSRKAVFIKYPRLIYLIYLPSLTAFVIIFTGFLQIGPYFNYLIGIYVGLSFASFIAGYVKIKEKKEKIPLRIVLWGLFLGMVPLGLLAFLPNVVVGLIGNTAVFVAFGMMTFLPISFGYAVMKYGLMDVGIVIKKGIVYSATTAFFILLYMGLVVGVGGTLARNIGVKSEILNALFIAVVALALNPVKIRVQEFVDKRFYPQKYTYRQMLLSLSRDLPTHLNLDEILKNVSETLKTAMQVEESVISVFESEGKTFRIYNRTGVPESCECDFLEYASGLSSLLLQKKRCITLYKIDDEPELKAILKDDLTKIQKAGLVLAIPMFLRDRLTGIILLGPKISGDIFTREDMDTLLTVAGQTAVAVENARLHLKELQRQRAEGELLIARQIQQDLLPKEAPQVRGLEIAGCSIPATEVGGDYFDYILQSDRRLLVFVGDVSGKGMPAALYMSKVQGMIQMAGTLYHSPKDILIEVNRKITDGIDKKSFITMLAVMFDVENKRAVISRAGHTPLFIKKSDREPAEVMLPRGIGLGITTGEDFDLKIEEVTIPMQSGECFVLYSDGLTEAMNPKLELFGEERLKELLDKNHQLPSMELRNLLVAHAREFQENEEQNDDITVVIVKIN